MLFNNKTVFVLLLLLLAGQLAFAQNASNSTNGTAQANATVNATLNITASNRTANVSASPSPSVSPSPTPAPTGAQLLNLEVSYFLESTESAETDNFTSGGDTYYLVKVGGKNQMVFDSGFRPVSQEAEIRKLIADNVQNLPLPFKKSDFQSLQTEFASVNSSWDYCRQVWLDFTSGRRVCIEQEFRKLLCWLVYDGDFGSTFKIPSANAKNRYDIGNGTMKLNNATRETGALLGRTDGDFDSLRLDGLKARLDDIKNVTSQIREGYTQFNSAHKQYVAYPPFATDGGLNRCAFNEKALANMEKLADSTATFPNSDALSNATVAGTKARLDKGTVRKLAAATEKKLSDFEAKYKKAKTDFETANKLEPTAITGAFVELTSLSFAVKNASTYESAKVKADEFESKRKSSEALISQSQDALVPYVDSLKNLNNASVTLEAAIKVYGQNDPRLTGLKTQLSTLRSNFELKEADLKHGRPVTAADFQGIAGTAANLTLTANALPRKENEIDWMLVGGLIVLVVLVAAAVWYLRKYKQKQKGS